MTLSRTVTLLQEALGKASNPRHNPRRRTSSTSSLFGDTVPSYPSTSEFVSSLECLEFHSNSTDITEQLNPPLLINFDFDFNMASSSTLPSHSHLSVPPTFGQYFHAKAEMLHRLDKVIDSCLRLFCDKFHPLYPIVDAHTFLERFQHKEHLYSEQFAAAVLAMSALPLFLSQSDSKPANARIRSHLNSGINLGLPSEGLSTSTAGSGSSSGELAYDAENLLREAMMLHNTPDLALHPSLDSIATTMLIGASLRIAKGFNASYLKVKEALALVELLDLGRPEVYDRFTATEKVIAVHIFWLLTSGER